MVDHGLQVDGAISVWVLQHCLDVAAEIALLHRALRPGGRLGIVNTVGRAVPTVEVPWASDGVNVRALLADRFTVREMGQMDEVIVGKIVREYCFWAAYDKEA